MWLLLAIGAASAASTGGAAAAVAGGHAVGEEGETVAGDVLRFGRGVLARAGVVRGGWFTERHFVVWWSLV